MKRKACPLLVQSNTEPSLTIQGASYARTFFIECLGEKCAAYIQQYGFCEKFQSTVIVRTNPADKEETE